MAAATPIKPLPIRRDTLQGWINDGITKGAQYLIVVHVHGICDPRDMDELWPRLAYSRRERDRMLAFQRHAWDGTVLRVIDLSGDIEAELAQAVPA